MLWRQQTLTLTRFSVGTSTLSNLPRILLPIPSSPPTSFVELWAAFKARYSLHDPPHEAHTYFHLTEDPSSQYSRSSRLDRILFPSALAGHPLLSPSVSIPHHHTNLSITKRRSNSFSDHLPVHLTYEVGSERGAAKRSIPVWLASSPEFAATWKPYPARGGAYRDLAAYKQVLFKAAKVTRRTRTLAASLPLRISHHLSLLRLLPAPCQDLTRTPLVTWVDNRWQDSGLLDASRNLITEASPSRPPPNHPIKTLAEKAPSSREHLGIKGSPDEEEVSSDPDRARVAANFWSKIWSERDAPSPHLVQGFLDRYTLTCVRRSLWIPSSTRSTTQGTPHLAQTAFPLPRGGRLPSFRPLSS